MLTLNNAEIHLIGQQPTYFFHSIRFANWIPTTTFTILFCIRRLSLEPDKMTCMTEARCLLVGDAIFCSTFPISNFYSPFLHPFGIQRVILVVY